MKVWINRAQLRSDQSIHNWIYVLTKHEVLNHIRDRKIYLQVEKLLIPDSSQFSAVEDMLQIRELDSRVREFVASMPEQRRRVFMMSRYRGLGNKEIAQMLGLSVRTVDRHINLALTSLRKEFLDKK